MQIFQIIADISERKIILSSTETSETLMATWARILKLTPEWHLAARREISVQAMATVVFQRLARLKPFGDDYLDRQCEEIADTFECLAGNPQADWDNFDAAMVELYNWGEKEWGSLNACSIRTF